MSPTTGSLIDLTCPLVLEAGVLPLYLNMYIYFIRPDIYST